MAQHTLPRLDRKRALAMIEEARDDTQGEGGADEGSQAITGDVYASAVRFLDLLQDQLETPEIVAEPDGWIEFLWYPRSWTKLSVSVGPDNVVSYVAFLGSEGNQHRGTCLLGNSIPPIVQFFLEQVGCEA